MKTLENRTFNLESLKGYTLREAKKTSVHGGYIFLAVIIFWPLAIGMLIYNMVNDPVYSVEIVNKDGRQAIVNLDSGSYTRLVQYFKNSTNKVF